MEGNGGLTLMCKKLPKLLFLLLIVFVVIIFCNLDLLKVKYKEITTINLHPLAPAPQKHQTLSISQRAPPDPPFCYFQPLSPADALEQHRLLNSTAWPETPRWPASPPIKQTTDPAHSRFTILPAAEGQRYVGDQLEVLVKMFDFQGQAKKSGGDFLVARLHNMTLGAGVVGRVLDHLNGSYSALFPLLWEGQAQVQVMLIHPSEAITVLRRLNRDQPDRAAFRSLFSSGAIKEITMCNVCLRESGRPICNFTDLHTGEPWFCYKPSNLSCDTRMTHVVGRIKPKLKASEDKLFKGGINMKVNIKAAGPAQVTVFPKREDQPEVETSIGKTGVSGFYYQGVWRGLGGVNVRTFNTPSDMNQCLRGKMVHMFGDSTVRQWFEYLNAFLPDAKQFDLHSSKQVGPLMILDSANKFFVKFRIHGPPLRSGTMPTSELHYIANEIDSLRGGDDTVIVFGIWAHFGTFPEEHYIRRLQSIRRAVVHLLNRAPGTVVIIRTPNVKALSSSIALTNSDWFSHQEDKILRAMFRGLNVHLVDAWEMVLAHHLPHLLHPKPPIIKNMVNVVLSHLCPQKSS